MKDLPEHPATDDGLRFGGRFSSVPRPFLRWAGSKQALLQQLAPLVPKSFGRYYEPFLGSGALFFALKPKRATLTDASAELISTWKSVRNDCDHLVDYLDGMKPDKDVYYKLRSNRSKESATRAAEFLYLNKTCWNGLYRVNSKGEFNVPYGAPRSDFIVDKENLRACSKLLSGDVSLRVSDFEVAVSRARYGDFVFFDPPYVTKHNLNGFRDWNEKLFSWDDQKRLALTARRLADRGVSVVISNAEHDDILELYQGFSKISVDRSSTLASDKTKRGRVTEAWFHSVQ